MEKYSLLWRLPGVAGCLNGPRRWMFSMNILRGRGVDAEAKVYKWESEWRKFHHWWDIWFGWMNMNMEGIDGHNNKGWIIHKMWLKLLMLERRDRSYLENKREATRSMYAVESYTRSFAIACVRSNDEEETENQRSKKGFSRHYPSQPQTANNLNIHHWENRSPTVV